MGTSSYRKYLVAIAAITALGDISQTAFAQEKAEGGDVAAAGPGVGEVENDFGSTLQKKAEPKKDAAEPAKEDDKRVYFKAGFDWTSAYYSRGFKQEDHGFIGQPWAEVGFKLHKWDDGDIGVFLGTWNSVHSKKTGASSTAGRMVDKWYESDVYIGLAATLGKFSLSTSYMAATSPNDAFVTCEEWQTRVSFDDSEYLGAWKLSPSVLIVYETGDGLGDGISPRGVYLEPSIAPGFTWEKTAIGDIEFSFPLTAGFSLSNYYQDANGDDTFCGYETIGAKASIPLPFNEKYGSWKLNAGVTMLFMNGACKDINNGHGSKCICNAGISCEF